MKASWFLIGLLLFTLYWIGELYQPFLKNIIIASLMALATHNLFDRLCGALKHNALAAGASTLIVAVGIFLPVVYLLTSLTETINTIEIKKIQIVIERGKEWITAMAETFPEFAVQIEEMLSQIKPQQIIENVFGLVTEFGKVGATFFKDLFLILIFYFFSLMYGHKVMQFLASIIPMKKEDSRSLFLEVANVMGVVFYSIFTIALLEGILFGIIVAIYGYDGILLGIMYGISSLIPVIGGIIMWIPVAAYEAVNGSVTNAIIILAYSIIVISIIADTFVKPVVIGYINQKIVKSPAQISELLIFFAIIAGLATFGFWGMILGPAITTFFISLLKLFQNVMENEDEESA